MQERAICGSVFYYNVCNSESIQQIMPGSSAVERVAVNHDVGGSSPPPAAIQNNPLFATREIAGVEDVRTC